MSITSLVSRIDFRKECARHRMQMCKAMTAALFFAGYQYPAVSLAMQQPAGALNSASQPRQSLCRLVLVEMDSASGMPTQDLTSQPLYLLSHPPVANGLQGLGGGLLPWQGDVSRLVAQTSGSQSSFMPILSGGHQQLPSAFSSAAQRGQADEQQGVMAHLVYKIDVFIHAFFLSLLCIFF